MVDASARLGRKEALELARGSSKVLVAKGKNRITFDMRKCPPDEDTLLAAVLGPTGNLRAPTIRVGSTLLVGFSDELYASVLG